MNQFTKKDYLFCLLLVLSSFILVTIGTGKFGISWDEANPNFPTIKKQAEWISDFITHSEPWGYLLSDEGVYDYWYTKSDHPSLSRTIAAISYSIFGDLIGEVRALRIPSAIYFSLMGAILYLWGTWAWGRVAGAGAAFSLYCLPRMFGHAHMAGLDIAITFWWVVVAFAFIYREKTWKWSLVIALLYIGALSTKLHSVFLPFPLLAYALWQRKPGWWRPFLLMGTLGFLGYIILQPWLWHHTLYRIGDRFFHYSVKATSNPIRLYYFETLFSNDTPWHYPIMMVLLTVPAAILLCFLFGMVKSIWKWKVNSIAIYGLLNFLTPLSLVVLPLAQAYDGTRLFLPAFPFVALLAGFGLYSFLEWIKEKSPTFQKPLHEKILVLLVCHFIFLPPFFAMKSMTPFQLSYYNEFIGGVKGGMERGMESTYWCEAIVPEFIETLNQTLTPGCKLKTLAMPVEPLIYYQELGLLRKDITIGGELPYDFHLLQARQGMFGQVEWHFYNKPPIAQVHYNGTPLIQLHGRLR